MSKDARDLGYKASCAGGIIYMLGLNSNEAPVFHFIGAGEGEGRLLPSADENSGSRKKAAFKAVLDGMRSICGNLLQLSGRTWSFVSCVMSGTPMQKSIQTVVFAYNCEGSDVL